MKKVREYMVWGLKNETEYLSMLAYISYRISTIPYIRNPGNEEGRRMYVPKRNDPNNKYEYSSLNNS